MGLMYVPELRSFTHLQGCVSRLPMWTSEKLFREIGSRETLAVLLFWGTADQVVGTSNCDQVAGCFMNSHLFKMRHATHLLLSERPQTVLANVATFLQFPQGAKLADFKFNFPFADDGSYVSPEHRKPPHMTLPEYLDHIHFRVPRPVRVMSRSAARAQQQGDTSHTLPSSRSPEELPSKTQETPTPAASSIKGADVIPVRTGEATPRQHITYPHDVLQSQPLESGNPAASTPSGEKPSSSVALQVPIAVHTVESEEGAMEADGDTSSSTTNEIRNTIFGETAEPANDSSASASIRDIAVLDADLDRFAAAVARGFAQAPPNPAPAAAEGNERPLGA